MTRNFPGPSLTANTFTLKSGSFLVIACFTLGLCGFAAMTDPYIRRALLNQHTTGEDRQPQELKVGRLSRPPTVLSTRPPRGSSPQGRYSPRGSRGRGAFNLSNTGGNHSSHGPGTNQTLPPPGGRGRRGQRFTPNFRPYFIGRGGERSTASDRGSPISSSSLSTHRHSQWQPQEFDLSTDRDGRGYDEIQPEMDEGSIYPSEISSGSRARDEGNYEQNGNDGGRRIRRGRHGRRTSTSPIPRLPSSQRPVPTRMSPSPSPSHPSDDFSPLQYPGRSSPPIAAFKFEDRSPPHSPLLGSTSRRPFSPSEIPNTTPPPFQNRNPSNTHESPRKRIRLSPQISAVGFEDSAISPTPHFPPTSVSTIPPRSMLPVQTHSRSTPPPPNGSTFTSYPPEPPPNRTKISHIVTVKPESRSPSPIAASPDLPTHGTTFIEMIPSCRLGPPNDLAEARRNRKLWRAEQKAILESQGKIVEHLVTRYVICPI